MDKREPWSTSHEANLVRPYTLTAGRTDTNVDLPLEAPIQTLRAGLAHRWPPNDARGKIIQLCTNSPSVAEISARSGADRPEALRRMTERYIEHMHTNEPVHTWPVTA